MDIFIYINIFIAGWISCQAYLVYKLRKALKKVAEDNGMSLEEMADKYLGANGVTVNVKKIPNYFTELNGSSILLYSNDTGDFISQAYSIEELAQKVYEFNKIKFAIVNHNDKQFWFVEGKVENDIQNTE